MKRANGTGSVYKLPGRRTKPWAARITIGWSDEGRQKYKSVGTYATKKAAQQALEEYLYIPDRKSSMTMEQAWQGWKSQTGVSAGTIKAYESAYKKMTRWHHIDMKDITLETMQAMVDIEPRTYSTASMAKRMLHAILSYAFANDCAPASRLELMNFITLPERTRKRSANIFSEDEIYECIRIKAVAAVILIFTGLRRDELLNLTIDQIHLDDQWIAVRKSKTQAGIRDVPIPDGLVPFVRSWIDQGAIGRGRGFFLKHFWEDTPVLDGHTRHDCRHTYITLLTRAGTDQRMIKALAGHTGTVTEDVYTHIPMSEKLAVVNRAFGDFFDGESTAQADDPHAHLLA